MHGTTTEETWRNCSPGRKPCPFEDFRLLLAPPSQEQERSKSVADHSPLQKQRQPLPGRGKPQRLPPDVRKDGLYHFPTWETRQRCKHCVGHFAHVYCEKCRVHLCLNKDRNCFQAYHNSK
ncbi:uncharacterized protein ACO6RY_15739 [Pungitius sinensis]